MQKRIKKSCACNYNRVASQQKTVDTDDATVKTCVSCRHRTVNMLPSQCSRASTTCPVTGLNVLSSFSDCYVQREVYASDEYVDTDHMLCGASGKFWEPIQAEPAAEPTTEPQQSAIKWYKRLFL
jgi:hypothetical protein